MGYLLRRVNWASQGCEERGDLRIAQGRILERSASLRPRRRDLIVDLEGHWVLPGLVNAHDHLGLDLLPALGTPPYSSFYDWAEEIYRPDESPIRDLERAPQADRLAWGAWRNVFGGSTAVAHHDPWHRRAFASSAFPVGVVRCAWAHSLGFEKGLHRRYRPDRPFVIHAAEGTDDRAGAEVRELERLDLLHENTFLVHAMALSADDIEILARRNCKVIWCPISNLHLYGQTAPITALRQAGVNVALGTDSTLSGGLTLLDELRCAAETGQASPDELLAMVTHRATAAFKILDGRGTLEPGGRADLIVLPNRGSAANSLLAARIRDMALVLVGGRARLAGPDIANSLKLGSPNAVVDGARFRLDDSFITLRDRLDRILGPDYPHGDLWHSTAEVANVRMAPDFDEIH